MSIQRNIVMDEKEVAKQISNFKVNVELGNAQEISDKAERLVGLLKEAKDLIQELSNMYLEIKIKR